MAKKAIKYPSKQTINLAALRERKRIPLVQLVPLVICVLLLAAAFGKFAVYDRFANAAEAQAELSVLRASVQNAKNETENFSEIKARYDLYCADWLTEDELMCIDRLSELALIEKEIMAVGEVESLSIEGNIIAVNLRTADLGNSASIVSSLYEYESVESVSVHTASSLSESGEAVISLIITMAGEGGEEE